MADYTDFADCTGFPVGNFGISAEITPDGAIFHRILRNPPVLGPWLEGLGQGRFVFTCDGVSIADSEFEHRQVDRLFPEAEAKYADPRFGELSITAKFLAPLKAFDEFTCSLPVLCVDFELENCDARNREITISFELRATTPISDASPLSAGDFWLVGNGAVGIGFDSEVRWSEIDGGISVSAAARVPAGGRTALRFVLASHDPRGCYAAKLAGMAEMMRYVDQNWERFKADRAHLIGLLPRTHDEKINAHLRWYLQAAVLLTRLTSEHVLTMGYCELNQRDSFWTSWPHLVLWPDLERRMIEESAEFQSDKGKIPTTVLPVIERGDDIDINEYFSLRIARYYEWTRDKAFLSKLWPSFRRSLEYLKSMDKDDDGLLDQGSFWADWKDVNGVVGRKAAPHFEFLYLAVLKSAKDLAAEMDDQDALAEYSRLYERSYDAVNRPRPDGGLWTGRFYTTLWYDGRTDDHVQQDQIVGPLYGVMPTERIKLVYDSLQANMTDWGLRDTYPYRENFSNWGGDYHNGGVWVFLNFADAFSRFVTGYPDGGYDILRRVAEWDLEKFGDYMAAEYLDGNTGRNTGKLIQGWDADYFAAVIFGILGVKMLSPGRVQVMPRVSDSESFDTPIVLPEGVIRVSQTGESGRMTIEVRSEIDTAILVRYGAMTSKSLDGCTTERIGECEFKVVEFELGPSENRVLQFS